MGVSGLWDLLRPTGEQRSLTHLAVHEGFEANPANVRGLRIGIDASIWFFHATYGREGENPELRTLFFRCARLMRAPFLPLFVFDGPKRPSVKRGKRISGSQHWLTDGMKNIIEAFGFEWRMAPGEAEAELAYLNSIGVIDAIISDDVDNFLFGARMVIRNPSATLSGNRAHPVKNSDGRDDGNHSMIYRASAISEQVNLTRGGMILVGLLSGGDYHPAGLPGCGPGIAAGLARCGFGEQLLDATQTLSREELLGFLSTWRASIRHELRTNSQKQMKNKRPTLAGALSEDFPDLEVLLSYTNPITSETDASARRTHVRPTWEREPDLGKIAHLCEMHFEWGIREIIIKRFREVVWPPAVLRILRRAVLEDDARRSRMATTSGMTVPSTPSKRGRAHGQDVPGTPSKMVTKHFSSIRAGYGDEGEDEEDLIVKIHATRRHASTDDTLEYRLEIAPAMLVRLTESGIQGLRKAADTTYDVYRSDEEFDIDEDEDGAGAGNKKKAPVEPTKHLRLWMPACMVERVRPDLVAAYEGVVEKRLAKKAGKGKTTTGGRGGRKKAAVTAVLDDDGENFDLHVSEGSEDDAPCLPTKTKKIPAPALYPSVKALSASTSKKPAPRPRASKKKTTTTVIAMREEEEEDFDLNVSGGSDDGVPCLSKKSTAKKAVATSTSTMTSGKTTSTMKAFYAVSKTNVSTTAKGKAKAPRPAPSTSDWSSSTRFTASTSTLPTPSSCKSSQSSASSVLNSLDKLELAMAKLRRPRAMPAATPATSASTPSAPRPFPVSFEREEEEESSSVDEDDDRDALPRPAILTSSGRFQAQRSSPARRPRADSCDSDGASRKQHLQKSPRKSREHTSPRKEGGELRRPESPSPSPTRRRLIPAAIPPTSKPTESMYAPQLAAPTLRPTAKIPPPQPPAPMRRPRRLDDSVIEISSDSDSDLEPPLPTFSTGSMSMFHDVEVIDLT